MKSKYIKILVSILIFLLLISSVILVLFLSTSKKELRDEYDKNIKILTDNCPTDIIIFGEDILFRDEGHTRKIKSLNEENLISEENNIFHFVIICDRKGELKMTDEDYAILKRYVFEKKYNLIYIGTASLKRFKANGFFVNIIDSEPSYGFQLCYNLGKLETRNFWSVINDNFLSKNDEYLGKYLFENMVSIIKPYYVMPFGY